MAVAKTSAEIATAAATVKAILNAREMSDAGRLSAAADLFARVAEAFKFAIYGKPTKTASGANAAALWTAATIADGDVWVAAGTGDTTDTLLATAKGSAPAAGDVFQRVGSTVVYVCSSAERVSGLTFGGLSFTE
jgi:hypothetical protein